MGRWSDVPHCALQSLLCVVENHIQLNNIILIWLFYLSKRLEKKLIVMQLAVISAALKQCYETGFVMGTFYMPDHLRFKINLLVWYYFVLISLKKKLKLWDIISELKFRFVSLGFKHLDFSRDLNMWKEKQNSDMLRCFILKKL